MSRETGEGAIDLALERTSERLHPIFFGGEPLLCWDRLQALTAVARERASASSVTVHPSVTTNGTLLTEERAAWLAEEGFLVAISCDGTAAAHDRNRVDDCGRGSHERTVAGLSRALVAGLPVRVVSVLDPSTVDLLPDSVDELLSIGARDIIVNVNWEADWSGDALARRWREAYEEVARRYVDAHRAGEPYWINIIDEKVATHVRGGYREHERCDFGRRDLVVSAGGTLYPCDRLVGEDADGCASRYAVGDVWSGVDRQRYAEVAGRACQQPAECLECDLRERCRNRCGCANLAMTGSVDAPSGVLCQHEQLAIACADAAAELLVAEENGHFLSKHYGGPVSPRG